MCDVEWVSCLYGKVLSVDNLVVGCIKYLKDKTHQHLEMDHFIFFALALEITTTTQYNGK